MQLVDHRCLQTFMFGVITSTWLIFYSVTTFYDKWRWATLVSLCGCFFFSSHWFGDRVNCSLLLRSKQLWLALCWMTVYGYVCPEQTGHRCFQIQGWAASGGASDQQQIRAPGNRQASEPTEETWGREPKLRQSLCRLAHWRGLSGNAKNTSM